MGGDGTILYYKYLSILRNAARKFEKSVTPPIISYSMGTLGFLCGYNLKGYKDVLQETIIN